MSRLSISSASALAAIVCGAAILPLRGAQAAARPPVPEFARKVGFDAAQIAALDRGEIVTRVLKTEMVAANDTAEVAVVGVVKVDAPREAFLEAANDVNRFRNVRHIRIGLVHNPPQASDFAGIEMPPDDVADLKACKPGKCALKLAGPGLADLQAKIDWKAKDANEQVNRFVRERLLAVMTSYMQQGTTAFKPLEDKSTGIHIDEQFKLLLANTGNLIAYYPELATYLRDFPNAKLDSSSDLFYWSLNDFSLKPTITVTHVVRYTPPGTGDAVIAWKQLYASHYFNGGLAITTYAKDPSATYLLHLDRVRADSLGG
ncbi:MAG TPA: hypothetical protein VL691_04565, partial [Vicinamibacteria bacterium]|nr:hypothetical protein [Vicinamibacteria bacterium]